MIPANRFIQITCRFFNFIQVYFSKFSKRSPPQVGIFFAK